ncbi:unnamed protein product [Zymoseptoria tritici ST99CH_3D1]|nr:unnamed protein product [Zymoseptoria tritici ST99CH_3D1]
MDINALLSPDDGSSSSAKGEGAPSSSVSPQKSRSSRVRRPSGGKRTASGLSHEVSRSPDRRPLSTTPQQQQQQQQALHQHHQQGQPHPHRPSYPQPPPPPAGHPPHRPANVADFRPPPPTSNPAADPAPRHQTNSTTSQQNYLDPSRPLIAHRPSSTPSMETLADLASIQQRQQTTRTYSANSVSTLRGLDAPSQQRPPLHSHTSGTPPRSRGISRQSLADLTMAEAPSQTPPPRDFKSSDLSEDESRTVSDLLNYLAENSYAYEQHVQLINLLHKGFLSHAHPFAASPDTATPSAPSSYALLNEMRQAREAMDTRFAVGEAIWADWLADEALLANTSDERIAMTELCQKAVQDEPASVILWMMFVDWVTSNYAACHDLEGAENSTWTSDDKEMCRELFTWEMVVGILEQAIAATKWRIDKSHLLWNRYAQMVQDQFPSNPTEADVKSLHSLFLDRLQVPHAAWDETRQTYWPIVSRFEGDAYEAVFEQVNKMAQPAQKAMKVREQHEFKLERAVQSGEPLQVHRELEKYLKSERFQHNKPGLFDYDLRCGLYERALLYEPTNTEWWLDYVDFVVTSPAAATQSLLPLIERATRHCPWSGELWARRILQADSERKSRDEIESTKHRATNAGLLDIGGMEELVRMLQEWCSYLRRHAFRAGNAEDDIDTAEVGITMALEDVQQAGVKIYGKDFKGDPLWRLEQIQLKFYTQGRRFDEARSLFQKLAKTVGHSYEFWKHYYNWELTMWGFNRFRDPQRFETDDNGPNDATAVVQEALRQRNVESPERILQLYLDHFRLHESGSRLHAALVEGREYANRLAATKAKQAEEAARVAAQQQQQYYAEPTEATAEVSAPGGEKRKRDDDTLTNGDSHKKSKTDAAATGVSEEPTTHVKRDREHNTITVKNLPLDVQEAEIKKFFKDCGNTPSVNILRDEENNASSATVEFETHEDVLAAKTRDGKAFEGREINISSGVQNTLYVTNYPAEWEESNIRDLLKSYGEIISIRLPSLKYNNRRRFCYVQFLHPDMAKAAEAAMDGTKLDAAHTILAKISNPDRKKARSGALEEGRELFVKNLDRDAPEDDLKKLFEPYGKLEKFNLLRLMNNKLTGSGFFTYSSAAEANAAIEALHNKPFHGRILNVALATPKGGAAPIDRAKAEDVIIKRTGGTSATPEPNGARRDSDVSMHSAPPAENHSAAEIRARKVAIFNLPDTVNDARITSAMEKFGPISKIQLRREKDGAIVEFVDSNHAFHVRQGVDLHSLGEGVTSGDVGDLLAIKKPKKAAAAPGGAGGATSLAFVPPAAARAAAGRGGRRGGLGFKRGGAGGFGGAAAGPKSDSVAAEGSTTGGKKSNADFRSMLEASKKPDEAANKEASTEAE